MANRTQDRVMMRGVGCLRAAEAARQSSGSVPRTRLRSAAGAAASRSTLGPMRPDAKVGEASPASIGQRARPSSKACVQPRSSGRAGQNRGVFWRSQGAASCCSAIFRANTGCSPSAQYGNASARAVMPYMIERLTCLLTRKSFVGKSSQKGSGKAIIDGWDPFGGKMQTEHLQHAFVLMRLSHHPWLTVTMEFVMCTAPRLSQRTSSRFSPRYFSRWPTGPVSSRAMALSS